MIEGHTHGSWRLGNTLHTTVGNTLTSTHITVGDVSVQTWGTTLKSTKIPLQPPTYAANPPGRPGPSHNQWQPIKCGLYNASEGPRCTYDPCKFAHRCHICGDLILPLRATCLSIPWKLNDPSGARVRPLQPRAEDTKLQLCQTIQAQD